VTPPIEPGDTIKAKGTREENAMPHTHRYTIADDEAVEVLVDKLISHGSHQQRREKLLKALEDASQHYNTSTERERKAFFHGLLPGYGVAVKLW
jgi:hypothetical protein